MSAIAIIAMWLITIPTAFCALLLIAYLAGWRPHNITGDDHDNDL